LLDAVGPVVRDVAVVVVVAVVGIAGAGVVLAMLRVRRRRAVLSARVVRTAVVTAVVIPAAGVPLALVAGAALWTGPLTVAAGWVMARFVWVLLVRPAVEMRRPGAYEAARALPVRAPGALPAPQKAIGALRPATVTVLSRTDERAVR
jgi:hypothetical protein